jgi:hypothetical protein
VTANFNDAAVNDVFARLESYAMGTGRFDMVNQHEPKSAPGVGVSFSVWIQLMKPWPKGSGMGITTGVVVFQGRIYTNFRSQPFDMIDPNVTSAAMDLMGSISGDFDLGGNDDVRNVDLLGASGHSLSFQAGYVEIDRQMHRVVTITIPIIINDMFNQEA